MSSPPAHRRAPANRRAVSVLLQQAIALHREGRTELAVPLLERAARDAPLDAEVQFLLGACLRILGRNEDARASLEAAVAADPRKHIAHFHLGCVHVGGRRLVDGRASFAAAAALEPTSLRYQRSLAQTCVELHDLDGALAAGRAAEALDPRDAKVQSLLGWACEMSGDEDGAERHYRRAPELDPSQAGVYYYLARMRRFDDVELLRSLVAEEERPQLERAVLHFAIGEILQRRDEHDTAFAAFAEGNRLMPAQHDAPTRTHLTTRAIEVGNPSFLEARHDWGDPTEAPVFIVGMPRSGSSLVEQILAAHPDVEALGERSSIPNMAVGLRELAGKTFPDGLLDLQPAHARALAAQYLREVEPRAGALRHTDKSPANFLYLGLIATLFPNARVIHTRRNPVDTCLSAYFTCFGPDRLMFSYDMLDLVAFYRDYQRMLEHWRRVRPLRMLEVDYETLVTGGETEMRRIVDFIGLPWSDACVDFHRLDRVCKTASRHQVNEELHTRACGRWKPYARHVRPLLELLEDEEAAA